MKHLFGLCALVAVLGQPAGAAMRCVVTATPLLVSAEGLAEPIGDIILQCGGGTPGTLVTGSFRIFLSARVSNAVNVDGLYTGIAMSQELSFGFLMDQQATIRPQSGSVLFENFQIPVTAQGDLALRFRGIRAEAQPITQALLQYSGNVELPLISSSAMVAYSQPTLLATSIGVGAGGLGPDVGELPDFTSLINRHAPMGATRVTEGWPAAFVPRLGTTTNGTRILIRLTGVPEGARILAPDGIAGANGFQPTQSGAMGSRPASGVYTGTPTGSLLLVRVRGAGPDGSGGYPAFYPAYGGASVLTAVSEADNDSGIQYLVYETMDSDPGQRESAEIPIWAVLPTDHYVTPAVVRQSLSLAPLSNQIGSVAGAPIPRYRAAAVASDCAVLGDCEGQYRPSMAVYAPDVMDFSAPAADKFLSSDFPIYNEGGGLLEWRVFARYLSAGRDWITISPSAGFNDARVRFNVVPTALSPGYYSAEIVVEQVGEAAGENSEVAIPISLFVTPQVLPTPPPEPPPPATPPEPLPTISEILDAANRWPVPAAPGSLVIITGVNFDASTSFTIGGSEARIVAAGEAEMLVEVPPGTATGQVDVVAANGENVGPPRALEIAAVAPGTLFVLNGDDAPNTVAQPAEAGSPIQVFMTGILGAAQPLNVKIHDRYLDVEAVQTDQPGVSVLKFLVPKDLPTTPSAVVVCAAPAGGGDASCSHPKDIWLRALGK